MVRMLDGRIDQQGVVSELRESGVLDYIAHDAGLHVKAEQKEEALKEPTAEEAAAEVVAGDIEPGKKIVTPRKLVQDEERQEGAVKWNVYNKYLEASSVFLI
jgi:hypothetical protein